MKFDPTIVQTRYASPLGPMIVAATAHGKRESMQAEIERLRAEHLRDTSQPPASPSPALR